MITITQAVREYLARSPFLTEILSEDLANATQMAKRIQPSIEKRLREKVTTASVTMAIHRVSKDLSQINYGTTFLKQLSDITVRSKIVEFIFSNTSDLPLVIESLFKIVKNRKDVFLHISQGLHESVVILNEEFEKDFLSLFKKEPPKRLSGLSVITMHLPEKSLVVPGVYYPILKALALEGISFVEVVSINTELSIVFNDADVEVAFGILKRITS